MKYFTATLLQDLYEIAKHGQNRQIDHAENVTIASWYNEFCRLVINMPRQTGATTAIVEFFKNQKCKTIITTMSHNHVNMLHGLGVPRDCMTTPHHGLRGVELDLNPGCENIIITDMSFYTFDKSKEFLLEIKTLAKLCAHNRASFIHICL